MKATQANLLKFLAKSPQQFIVPIYQRNYEWKKEQCKQLWDDIILAGTNEKINAHFIGSIVYIERDLSSVTTQEPLLVIDGQQRLTTCTLLISALAKYFEENGVAELQGAFSARKLRNYYLINEYEEGMRRFKLILSETDRDTLLSILESSPMPAESSFHIQENYELFKKWIAECKDGLEVICKGLAKLVIVDVSLDRSQDNPQMIFESMNSTGLDLSQADLIRNYILMGVEPKLQTELYQAYWRPMEKGFGQEAYAGNFDAFMRYYLTAKTGNLPNVRDVYKAFKDHEKTLKIDIKDLVKDIYTYASHYCAMALGAEKDPVLKNAFHDLRELKVDVAYPFLLVLYHDYKNKILTSDELHKIVRWVESYVFRRSICAIPTNSLNKIFAGMCLTINKDRYLESVMATFLLLPSYRRFPDDIEFEREIKVRDLYNRSNRNYWLRRLENYGRKERIIFEDYTIEHIMPQNEKLSKEWQDELGGNWQSIQKEYLHRLGNLTLTGYNSEYSDFPFAYKCNQVTDKNGHPIGFSYSPLKLNIGLGHVSRWNEDAIKLRADRLAKDATMVWSAPQLSFDILDRYRPVKSGQLYSIDDHPYLASGLTREFFDALRNSVLALDPCINEDFLKYYVAYKAETNFVDVVPQSKRLRLFLNMDFNAIDDPKGSCIDVSKVGHLGNGNVEVILSSLEELPYIVGLIRQSFDQQMGNSEA